MTQGELVTRCERCGAMLPAGALVCPNCGLLVHVKELEALAGEAMRLEAVNPAGAIELWQRVLQLLPSESPQWQMVTERMGMLVGGSSPRVLNYEPRARVEEPLLRAIFKTVGSMVISIVVYAWYFGSGLFAAGFVILMLVHELGHVIANRYYGLKAGPPVFIPFLGAIINLKERPANAKVEAVIGIGGPVLGTIGAIACYGIYLQTRIPLFVDVAFFGFLLNLFNLLPVPPLDGGRVTAAMSPWIWVLGLAGLAWMFVEDWRAGHFDWILLLVLLYAWPRIRATLQGKARFGDYYKISRAASWTIGVVYVALGVVLIYLFQHTKGMVFGG